MLLATFSEALARSLRVKLRRLISHEPKLSERVEVYAMDALGERLYTGQFGKPHIATTNEIRDRLSETAARHPESKFQLPFLYTEWRDVVDARQLQTWEDYRDVQRLGRRTRLSEARRRELWSVFDEVRVELDGHGWTTVAGMFRHLEASMRERERPPFDFAVIDESQDISAAQLRFLAALGGGRPNALFFAGDIGQRIFQQPFSWKSQGIDIRGRARTLRVNYRTSHQIRQQADRLLGPELADVDGNVEERRGTVSVFNGPEPVIRTFPDFESEADTVSGWLRGRTAEGVPAQEIGVFVRSETQLNRARQAVGQAGLEVQVLDESHQPVPDRVSIATMHLAKGMEFRAVAVMACDDEVIPLQQRIENVIDDAELEDVYNTERHLLYVACTRARDELLVTAVDPASEFLGDLTAVAV